MSRNLSLANNELVSIPNIREFLPENVDENIDENINNAS